MEFGMFMEFHVREGVGQAGAFEESLGFVDMAEDLGLDAIWMAESHFNPSRAVLSSPMVVGAAIAGRTQRIKIGTAVHVLPLGNPLRTAEETATLDQISNGRLDYGVGRSGLPGAYEGYNIPYAESRERFYECLEVIVKAWTNDRFSHQGKYYSFEDVCLVPKPAQTPHPPIRVAATTNETFGQLGKMGYPIFVGVRGLSMPQVAEQVKAYEKAWKDAGHVGPIDVSLRVPVYVADTQEAALRDSEESFMRQFQRLGAQLAASVAKQGSGPDDQRTERAQMLAALSWDRVQGQKVAVGTPEAVIDQLGEMKETLHLSGVVAEFNAGELIPRENIASAVRLFCQRVVPAFK